ncbi:MAG: organelle trafficking lipoprotein defect DotA [uncultured bacterium]|nr:MAG: organelle trafficking lipoprotein defect DotA [uncultured bacterium]
MSKYEKLIWMLVLILFPCIGLAADDVGGNVGDIIQKLSFTPPTADVSVRFLADLFGDMPVVTQFSGRGINIIGTVFAMFNAGVLAVAGVFLGYTIFKIVTETTMDGSTIGKATTVWTAARTGLAIIMLIPQTSGYSLLNGLVMWVVIQGVGLADSTWGAALDYLKGGGISYQKPPRIPDYSLINYDILTGVTVVDSSNSVTSVGSADVLRSLSCSKVVIEALNKKQEAINIKAKAALADYKQKYPVRPPKPTLNPFTWGKQKKWDDDMARLNSSVTRSEVEITANEYSNISGKAYVFPLISDNPNSKKGWKYDHGFDKEANISENTPSILTGICGVVNYTVDLPSDEDAEKKLKYTTAKESGLTKMITTLEPVAGKLVENALNERENSSKLQEPKPEKFILYEKDGKPITFIKDDALVEPAKYIDLDNLEASSLAGATSIPVKNWPYGATEMLQAALQYQVALEGAQTTLSVLDIQKKQEANIEAARKKGWLAAGGYYYLLKNISSLVTKEYTLYRLQAAKSSSNFKIIDEASARLNRTSSLAYGAYFSFKSNEQLYNTLNALKPVCNDKLRNALRWIHLAAPYAKLYGESNLAGTNIQLFDEKYTRLATKSAEEGFAPEDMTVFTNFLAGFGSDKSGIMNVAGWLEATAYTSLTIGAGGIFATVAPLLGMLAGTSQAGLGVIVGLVVGLAVSTVGAIAAIPALAAAPPLFLASDMLRVLGSWNELMVVERSLDPILKLQMLGNDMMLQSAKYLFQMQIFFVTVSVASVTASTVGILANIIGAALSAIPMMTIGISVQSAIDAITKLSDKLQSLAQTVVYAWMPLGMAVITPIFVTGITLALYIPLIPYLLFLFGVMSWFISVLVLMAAAPIICFLMVWGAASQEHPLLSREADLFVMQLVGIFFRPVLMIIGLIVGMSLAYVGISILNIGFAHIYNNIAQVEGVTFGWKGGWDSIPYTIVYFVKIIAFMILYTFTMISIVNMCFSLIHLLYTEVMSVMSIRAPGAGAEEAQLQAVKTGATELAQAGIGGLKEQGAVKAGLSGGGAFGEKKTGGEPVQVESGEEKPASGGKPATAGSSSEPKQGGGGALAK